MKNEGQQADGSRRCGGTAPVLGRSVRRRRRRRERRLDSRCGGALKGTTIEVAAKWTGQEETNFRKVLQAFEQKTGAKVNYASTGENTDAYLGPRIEAGNPPDVAILPQPGLMQQYAEKGSLKPLAADVVAEVGENYSPYWKELGSADGKAYGVIAKAAYKSILWYRPEAFDEGRAAARGLGRPGQDREHAAGRGHHPVHPRHVGPQDSWTLTDWFENVYLSQAGPENYDKLAKHEIKWTDPTVGMALETLAEIWGKPDFLNGGVATATKTKFDESVTQVFGQQRPPWSTAATSPPRTSAPPRPRSAPTPRCSRSRKLATPPRRSSAATSRSR